MCQRLVELKDAMEAYSSAFDAGRLSWGDAKTAVSLAAAIEHMAATVKALAAARAASDEVWKAAGHRSAEEELARATGTTVAGARDALALGRRLADQPDVSDAARRGALSPAQAAAISDAVAVDPSASDVLLHDAATGSLGDLKDRCAEIKAAAVDQEARRRQVHGRRRLRDWAQHGEWYLAASGTPEDGAQIMAAIAPLADEIFHAARLAGRREHPDAYRFDALVNLCTRLTGNQDAGTDTNLATPASAGGGPIPVGRTGAAGSANGPAPPDAAPAPAPGSATSGPGPAAPGPATPGPDHATHGPAYAHPATPGPGPAAPDPATPGPATGHPATPGPGPATPGLTYPAVAPTAGPAAGHGRGPAPGLGFFRPPSGPAPAPSPGPVLPASATGPPGGARQAEGSGSTSGRAKGPRHRRGAPVKLIVRVDLTTLMRGQRVAGEVCDLVGYGPIPVSALHDLVANGDTFITAVLTKGKALAGVAHLGRAPNAYQQTALQWLYPTCAAEGCPATTAHLQSDHRIDWAQTHFTILDWLDRLCTHHHNLKTRSNWSLVDGTGKRPFVPPTDPRHPNYRPCDPPP